MDKAYFCSMLKDNIYRKKRLIRSLLGVAALVATLYSCASMGRPDGGPFDETPPRFIGSTPAAGGFRSYGGGNCCDGFGKYIGRYCSG